MVVDDGEENRDLLQLLLGEAGLDIETAVNGQEALDKGTAGSFDVILMDIQMPVMDGLTSVGLMREKEITVPVIALTAEAMKGVEQECLAAGYSGYMTKPIDIDKLLEFFAKELGGSFEEAGTEPILTDVGGEEPEAAPIYSTLPVTSENIRELIARFIPRLAEKLGEMEAAIAQRDFEELAALAHWMKGSAGTVGFHPLTEPAKALEKFAKEESITDIVTTMIELRELSRRIAVDEGDAKGEVAAPDAPAASVSDVATEVSSAQLTIDQSSDPITSSLPLDNPKLRELVGRFIVNLMNSCLSFDPPVNKAILTNSRISLTG